MNVNSKYLKDEDGNIISPIVSSNSVYTDNGLSISNLVPIVLYDNESGSNEDITLSDSAENYSYMEIFSKTNDSIYNSTKVDTPNGKLVSIINGLAHYTSSEGMRTFIKIRIVKINGDTITTYVGNDVAEMSETKITNSSYSVGIATTTYITKVLGYKEIN